LEPCGNWRSVPVSEAAQIPYCLGFQLGLQNRCAQLRTLFLSANVVHQPTQERACTKP
jgi:hypothetical protein